MHNIKFERVTKMLKVLFSGSLCKICLLLLKHFKWETLPQVKDELINLSLRQDKVYVKLQVFGEKLSAAGADVCKLHSKLCNGIENLGINTCLVLKSE